MVVNRVLSCNAYAKTLSRLRTVSGALERLLIEQFMKKEEMTNPVDLLNLAKSCNSVNLNHALEEESSQDIIKKHREFEDNVHFGHLEKNTVLEFIYPTLPSPLHATVCSQDKQYGSLPLV